MDGRAALSVQPDCELASSSTASEMMYGEQHLYRLLMWEELYISACFYYTRIKCIEYLRHITLIYILVHIYMYI